MIKVGDVVMVYYPENPHFHGLVGKVYGIRDDFCYLISTCYLNITGCTFHSKNLVNLPKALQYLYAD